MNKRILWLSRHAPLAVQLERLRKKFGADTEIVQDALTFSNGDELIGRFQQGGFDDWVVVAPQSVLGRLCQLAEQLNVPKPLFAEMAQLPNWRKAEADTQFNGRYYRFVQFRRVKRAVLEFVEGEDF